jgi:zinc/manganese transport system permease protein
MSELTFMLSFYMIPLLTALVYAVIVPPLGAALYLRNEILLGIVLPPFGSAMIGLAVILGIPVENRPLLYSIVAGSLFLLLTVLPLGYASTGNTSGKKEMVLAAVFVFGQTFTYLFMHISPHVHANLSYLLSGEILATGSMEFWTALFWNALLLCISWLYRGVIYSYCLDEEGLRILEPRFKHIEIAYRSISAVVITSALVCIGPLLTTILLVLPPLLGEKSASGIGFFFIMAVGIGVLGTLAGFIVSIVIDFPPVYMISSVLFATGGLMIIKRWHVKNNGII